MSDIASISPTEAQALVERGEVLVLDVRTPGEFVQLGHIPGAWLLPVNLIASAPAVLPRDGRRVIVCCEHGVRSVAAVQTLVAAGLPNIVNMAGGMSLWSGPRSFESAGVRGPASWLLQNADRLPKGGDVLDVAAGRGRHALLMASAGFRVHAIDRDARALEELQETADRLSLTLRTEPRDLEIEDVDLGASAYDVVLVFNYLHRPLMPALIRALRPGGVLFGETFTIGQAERGHPKNPAFLLKPGELAALVAPLTIERSREGDVDGSLIASVVARKAE